MPLGTDLEVNIGTIAVPELTTLPFLFNDAISGSEYRLKDTDRTSTVQVRHTTEKKPTNGKKMDRHQVLFRQSVFPDGVNLQGYVNEVYVVIRTPSDMPSDECIKVINGLNSLIGDADVITAVLNGQG